MLKRKWKIRAISFLFVGAAGFIFWKVSRSAFSISRVMLERSSNEISEKNEFKDVVYTSFDKDSNEIILESSKVRETSDKVFDFSNLVTTFNISPDETATIFADDTHFVSKDSKQCEMNGNVRLLTEEGLLLETEQSFIDMDKKIAHGDTEILITQDDTKFFAKKYKFDMGNKVVTLTKDVKGNLANDLIIADKLVIDFDKAIGKDFKKVHAFGNSSYKTVQYNIRSSRDMIYTDQYAEANGNVDLDFKKNKHNYRVKSDHITMDLKENVIEKVVAKGNLRIKVDDATSIQGSYGILENDLLTITGNTVIFNEKGKILCKKAILNMKTNDIRVYESKGVIKKN
ncbi:MAG: LPS export ABC transporter periplasmic protein LptC [Alphaproteobacteria bacterium]|nr:LPS export ABC transporter periplasmic protein LptC [Alphaproteobacteria bacterium]